MFSGKIDLPNTIKNITVNFIMESPQTQRNKLLRQVTECDYLVGSPVADNKIRENNAHNRVSSGEPGYVPLSHEKKLCEKYAFQSPLINRKIIRDFKTDS